MGFSVRLTPDLLQVEPGATVPVGVEVVNKAEQADTFEVSIEGLDPEWTAVPVPTFRVEPGETATERFFLKPPRASESLSGAYPFAVRVRSYETGEARSAQGMLEVKPFNHLAMDVQPRKGVLSAFAKECSYKVTAINLGNTDHTLQLYANDPDDAFAYEFHEEQVAVAPGQQKEIDLTARARRKSLLSNPRLSLVSVTGRSIATPSASASVQAQLEQRALFTPGTVLLSLLVLVILGAWYVMRPMPPVVQNIRVEPEQALVGQPVTVSWDTSHAEQVEVRVGDVVRTFSTPGGSEEFILDAEGSYEVTVTALRGDRSDKEVWTGNPLVVSVPAPEPPPTILSFDVTPREIGVGQTYLVRYRLGESVVRATLQPIGVELDPRGEGRELTAQVPGTFEFKLVAFNRAGVAVERSVRVSVVERSKANIIKFEIRPTTVDPAGSSAVTVEWLLTGAVRAELSFEGQSIPLEPSEGSYALQVSRTTTFKLTAYDSEGLTVSREVTVQALDAPPPVADPAAPSEF